MDTDRYISNSQYRADKARLTRAKNTGDPIKVLDTVERTLEGWDGKVWPDSWTTWAVAVDDAYFALRAAGHPETERAAALVERIRY